MNSEGPRILVVDDDPEVRTLCREFLELANYTIEEACNGAEALDRMEETSFSLVLSDVMMPDINGLELASTVRERYPDTLVILITGHGSIDLAKEAIQRGAFDFVTKPFRMNETVERALEIRSRQLSSLPSPELKDLYDLTVNVNISERSLQAYLDNLVEILLKTFRGDLARIYLTSGPGSPDFSISTGSGSLEIIPEDDWRKMALATMETEMGVLDGVAPGTVRKGLRSMISVPIPSAEGSLGACIVARNSSPVEYSSRDLKLMGLFAAQAGNQLINFRMTSNLRLQTETLKTVNLLSSEFSSSLDMTRVLASISRGLRRIVEFDLFGVFLSGKNMASFSYMLVRSDIPEDVLYGEFRSALSRKRDSRDADLLLETDVRDSFACLTSPDWNSPPVVEVLDLGDFGSLMGFIALGDWSGCGTIIDPSSHIPILLRHSAAALSNAYLFKTNESNYIQTIAALAETVDAKDRYTHNHSRNVAAFATNLGSRMELPSREISLLNNAALLHDIGKIGIPELVLNKPGSLTVEEYRTVYSHPEVGYNILKPITAFDSFIDAVRHHHERYDGSGYPAGLEGQDIPLYARVLSVADSFEAMTSDRPYRKALELDYAREEIRKNLGIQFDPGIGRIFLDSLDTVSPGEMIDDYLSASTFQLSINHE